MADDAEYARWERGNIRGFGKQRRFLRTERDVDGNEVHVYEANDEDEWGTGISQELLAQFNHVENHRSRIDPTCKFCQEFLRGNYYGR